MTNKVLKFIHRSKLEYVTTVMGLVGHLATYIQVGKIFYLHSSYAVSFIASVISFTSMIFWLIYGIEMRSKALIICNIFGLLGVSLIILGIAIYGSNFW